MKTFNLPNVPSEIAEALEEARHEDVVVRLSDGRTRANVKLMELLDSRARQTKLVPLDEVKRRFNLK